MITGKTIVSFLRAALLTCLLGLGATCSGSAPPEDLPEIVYICPMVKDASVLEQHAGKCPICGMELKPVRIVTAYSCLNNTAFIQGDPGKCPTNGTDLVPITASMFWVCGASPDKRELDPGKCGDGSDRIRRFEPRLHGDHNPRHGGQLFMADDAWHHLEGVYPSPGLFRVYFYDDWTRPLVPAGFTARLIVKDSSGKEMTTVPLQPGQISNAMEGKVPIDSPPLSTSLHVRFKAGEPEKLFDFTFKDYSRDPGQPTEITSNREPAAPGAATATAIVPGAVVPANAASSPPSPTSPPAPAADRPALSPADVIPPGAFQTEPIPAQAREVLAELKLRSEELAKKIEHREPLGEYWVPALRTKDLALALLNDHLTKIPSRQRPAAENAVSRLLRAAYAIDNFGDLGDLERILSAHEEFVVAVSDLRSAYASIK